MTYMPDTLPDVFVPNPATPDEVEQLIKSFKEKKGNINTIPIFIFKKLSTIIAPVICNIFNSAAEGTFPSILKIARVIPLHKAKSRKVKNNYRPISLLPFISKLIEKLIKIRACKFIDDQSILYNNQFGFRPGYSTTDALLHLVNDCTTALDNKEFTITIFLDLGKAFDTVNKDIMLTKLHRYGFRDNMNDFFRNYLTDRRMYVCVNEKESETRTTNIGLPQGSVSAPWLFSLYLNDMNRVSKKLTFLHFADDTVIYMTGNDLKQLCEEVCDELKKVDNWLQANRLSLNIDKTCYMIHTHRPFDVDDCTVVIRNRPLQYVKMTKFLGMTLDDRFNYNAHVRTLSKQLARVKGILYKMSNVMPPDIIKNLYNSLFFSRMNYAISVWGGGNITNINKINSINRSAISIFCNKLPCHVPRILQFSEV